MTATIDQFFSRWTMIEKETISSVRRQLNSYEFDVSIINSDFQASCNEWFTGCLAPSLWYDNLIKTNPVVAKDFRHYVKDIQLTYQKTSPPKKLLAYIVTAISLPITYGVLVLITNWWAIGKLVFSIGIAILIWTLCQTFYQKQIESYRNKIIDSFREQLKRHGDKLGHHLQ